MTYEIKYNSSRSQLPRKIKQFAEISFSASDFEIKWSKLKVAIEKIFSNIPITTTLEILFRMVESFPQEISVEVFDNLRQLCLKHVSEFAPILYKDDSKDSTFLEHVTTYWRDYCNKIEIIKRIFLSTDRRYWSTNPTLMSFEDMAVQLWRDMYVTGPLVNKTMSLCLKEIKNHRSMPDQDISLSSAVAKMFIDLDLYSRYWEPKYLEEAWLYHSHECKDKLAILSYSEYFSYVSQRLEEEKNRSQIYLSDDSIRLKFRDQLVNIIVQPQLDGLLKSGFNDMMNAKDLTNLELLYGLTQLIKSLESSGSVFLRKYFRDYVMKVGTAIVENPDDDSNKDKKMTQELLDLKAYLDSVVAECFKNDASFFKTVRDCFEAFLNARPNKPAEYLAKFLDSKLRSGHKNVSDEAMEATMDKVMTLFRFITGKDVFEAFYLKDLAKRLLMGKSACVDTEKAMLEKLKRECGPNYTRKMEVMFSDIENSQRLSRQFSESGHRMTTSEDVVAIEMNVSVICNATWPNLGGSKLLNLPQAMIDLQNDFCKFYKTNHNGRKLRFEPSLGTCIVRGFFSKGRKELQVSEHQCMVLLQFNGGHGDLALTYRDIEKAVGMEPDIVKKTLLSLSAGKGQRVLTKKPTGTHVNEDDVFSFNDGFHHKLTKIKFNQIQTKETKEEQQATEEQVFADRQAHLDCCIVRLMKCNRSIEHTLLVTEVLKELRFPLKGSDIKKRIEHLIERDYISRDSSNSSMYHYVA